MRDTYPLPPLPRSKPSLSSCTAEKVEGMKIFRISLSNFMSHENTTINLKERLAVLVGPNDSGKTNIIRAVRRVFEGMMFEHQTIGWPANDTPPFNDGKDGHIEIECELKEEEEALVLKFLGLEAEPGKRRRFAFGYQKDANLLKFFLKVDGNPRDSETHVPAHRSNEDLNPIEQSSSSERIRYVDDEDLQQHLQKLQFSWIKQRARATQHVNDMAYCYGQLCSDHKVKFPSFDSLGQPTITVRHLLGVIAARDVHFLGKQIYLAQNTTDKLLNCDKEIFEKVQKALEYISETSIIKTKGGAGHNYEDTDASIALDPNAVPYIVPPNKVLQTVRFGDRKFYTNEASGSFRNLLDILISLLVNKACTVFLDEPGATLHSVAQKFLLHYLQLCDQHLFIVTHSEHFITPWINLDCIHRIYRDGPTSKVAVLPTEEAPTRWIVDPKSRPLLFSEKVLFVEGINDERVLNAIGSKAQADGLGDRLLLPGTHWTAEIINLNGCGGLTTAIHCATALSVEWKAIVDSDAVFGPVVHAVGFLEKSTNLKQKLIQVKATIFEELKKDLQAGSLKKLNGALHLYFFASEMEDTKKLSELKKRIQDIFPKQYEEPDEEDFGVQLNLLKKFVSDQTALLFTETMAALAETQGQSAPPKDIMVVAYYILLHKRWLDYRNQRKDSKPITLDKKKKEYNLLKKLAIEAEVTQLNDAPDLDAPDNAPFVQLGMELSKLVPDFRKILCSEEQPVSPGLWNNLQLCGIWVWRYPEQKKTAIEDVLVRSVISLKASGHEKLLPGFELTRVAKALHKNQWSGIDYRALMDSVGTLKRDSLLHQCLEWLRSQQPEFLKVPE